MIPQVGIDVIKGFEGFHHVVQWTPQIKAVPYICPAGYWTIGYGILCSKEHPSITKEEGELMLMEKLPYYYNETIKLSPILSGESDYRLGAILSFVFNLGPTQYSGSTLRRKINEGNWEEAKEQIKKWVYGGGRILPGLVARRELESLMLAY